MITDKTYKEEIKKYQYLIGRILQPANLPLLYLIASEWETHGTTQGKWLMQKHGSSENQTILTAQELKQQIDDINKIEWDKQILEIFGVFRNENNGRVFFHPIEEILSLNKDLS